jgi:hypothetical protein
MNRYALAFPLLVTLAAGTVFALGGTYSVRTLPLPDNNAPEPASSPFGILMGITSRLVHCLRAGKKRDTHGLWDR